MIAIMYKNKVKKVGSSIPKHSHGYLNLNENLVALDNTR